MVNAFSRLLKFAAFLIFCMVGAAFAQTYTVNVQGLPITCKAWNGQQVPFFSDPNAAAAARLLGGARADFTPGFGYSIALDPVYMNQLSQLGALFVMFHECAHVALPMGVGMGSAMAERNADCHAVHTMKMMGFIQNWNNFAQAMSALYVSGGAHGVDPARVNAMAGC